jgi:hypothetical protein
MPWPKGKPRKKVSAAKDTRPLKQRAGNNWDDEKSKSFLDKVRSQDGSGWRDRSADTLFDLSEETHGWLRQNNLDAQWITKEIYGQPQDRHFGNLLANGWVPVEQNAVPGLGVSEIGGSVLCVRPMAISEKARKAEKAKAQEILDLRRQQFQTEGVPLPSGAGRHPTAVTSNRLNRSLERIDIPGDEK